MPMFQALSRTAFAVVLLACGSNRLSAQTAALPPITEVPPSVPYRWQNVAIKGGGFISGVVFSPSTRGLVYARTDVGGAYRSEDAGDHWSALNDGLGRDESTYLGIESLALDPGNPDKLYLASGMYSADWGGPAAFFRSSDRGRTFARTIVPFKMGGNDNGRGAGERLAVDPNLGSTLFFGSRKAGLWKSSDGAVTWTHVDAFPVKDRVTGPGENTGITFVLFDGSTGAKGSATKTLYAGVAQSGASLYRSDDAGATWQPVPGLPKDLFPTHAALNPKTSITFTFVDGVGPNGITNGAILKLSLADGNWKDISPIKPVPNGKKFGFGGISLDAQHPETLMVTTIDRWYPSDTVYRTTDGGKHWKDVLDAAQFSARSTPWVYWHKDTTGGRGWMSAIGIDPFNPAKVLYTTGEGFWGSADVTAADSGKVTHWGFPNEGIEETVPLAIISPAEGAPLLSAVGDIGGFRHEDLRQSPRDGFFIDPQLSTASSLDFAALVPALTVRVGYGDAKNARGGYSLDNGLHWKPFGQEPASSTKGGGKIALSSDGKIAVWSPDHGVPAWSADWGKSWSACGGLSDKMSVVSDRVNPAKFYSFNAETGQLLESLNGARTFSLRTEAIARKGRSALLAAVPGREGDLWIAAGDEVFHSSDSGVTFVQLKGMVKAYTIGFGRPAAGSNTPAVFINGIAAAQEGLFRSSDGGSSWQRVDDDQHRFGWKNALTGDPRVFGRVYLATGGRGIIFGEPAGPTTQASER